MTFAPPLIGGLIGSLFGDVEGILYALLLFIVADYVTGLIAAVIENQLSSKIGLKGIFKKIVLLVLVAVAHSIDMHILKHGGAIRTTVIFFYLSNEGLSILENAVRIGLPVPEKLRDLLKCLKDGESKT
ncbi:phage holin family protein [Streptococcus suis]|nr:phage holin family protein [Streptococcus suis]